MHLVMKQVQESDNKHCYEVAKQWCILSHNIQMLLALQLYSTKYYVVLQRSAAINRCLSNRGVLAETMHQHE